MMKAVIGLGFGDEGKGCTVDWLCNQSPDSTVVRFSGGPQAGHNVSRDDYHHVFSSFGSGTLNGCPTIWEKQCAVNPVSLKYEYDILVEKGASPVIYIDKQCPIITPYDIYGGRSDTTTRDNGSCGMGIRAVQVREDAYYSLKMVDVDYPWVFMQKLDAIQGYYESLPLSVDRMNLINAVEWMKGCEDINIGDTSKLTPPDVEFCQRVGNILGIDNVVMCKEHKFEWV